MSEEEEEEGAKQGWSLSPAISFLHVVLDGQDSLCIADPGDSTAGSEVAATNGGEIVPSVEECTPAPRLERDKEILQTSDDDAVAAAERKSSLKALLVGALDKHSPRTSSFRDLQQYDLDNVSRYLTVEPEPGVQLEGPRSAPLASSLIPHPPLEHLRMIGNGPPVSQTLFDSPGVFVYGSLMNGPTGSSSMAITPFSITDGGLRSTRMAIAHSAVPYPREIQPFIHRSAFERKRALIEKLVSAFPRQAKTLMQLPDARLIQDGPTGVANEIHVFVDFSNILIGFFDCLKMARGIPLRVRMRRVPFSFHSFSMILERGRSVSKKALLGSRPLVPAMTEAEQCGYEVSLLKRVPKSPEATLRLRANGNGMGNGNSAASSGSDAASGSRRKTEQGVDEILQMKILESIVDVKEPSTIVLASGDAAVAEYSEGFLKTVVRALEKGWKVELVSFAKSMSSAYRSQAFLQKWKDQFQIIKLDPYAEELLDM
ncbi:MAG: hypothetical protein M1816_003293 [Peltula sp. TS41687]|nr:MAG: hypothetical protein M1816_003293 [Peltula sp. TS41687]